MQFVPFSDRIVSPGILRRRLSEILTTARAGAVITVHHRRRTDLVLIRRDALFRLLDERTAPGCGKDHDPSD